jgi:hypothetical protein
VSQTNPSRSKATENLPPTSSGCATITSFIIYLSIYHVHFQIREITKHHNHHLLSLISTTTHQFLIPHHHKMTFLHLLYKTQNIKIKIEIFSPATTAPESETTTLKTL